MPTGRDLVTLAAEHVGEDYRNVRVAKNNANWRGPWDCAEFVSWCVFQLTGRLHGCSDNGGDPAEVEAFTGFWVDEASSLRQLTSAEAARTAGAIAIRRKRPTTRFGHIVISDGNGGTVEAHSRAQGVKRDTLSGRTWDFFVLVPGIDFSVGTGSGTISPPPPGILRLTHPFMRNERVRQVQTRLRDLGFDPGPIDSKYGPMTESAVYAFQHVKGLVEDGEVGPQTLAALELD